MSEQELANKIDHTLLKATANIEDIRHLCNEAITHGFFSVCVNSYWVKHCRKFLKKSPVKVCTVVGFPLGAASTEAKVAETKQAIKDGADEIDMVIAVGLLKSNKPSLVAIDIAAVVKAAKNKPVKVILETALLTDSEKRLACRLAKKAKAKFVKTCTGFGGGSASIEDIELMKSEVGKVMQIKASGGIKEVKFAKALLSAGANRLGTSSGVALVQGLNSTSGGY